MPLSLSAMTVMAVVSAASRAVEATSTLVVSRRSRPFASVAFSVMRRRPSPKPPVNEVPLTSSRPFSSVSQPAETGCAPPVTEPPIGCGAPTANR